VRYRDLFGNREFSALYVADVLSLSGSYLAKIAVAALVFQRTHSTTWTAAAIAMSYAPYLLSPWLSTIADLYARRRTLIACEVLRGGLTAVILIGGLPLGVLLVLLFAIEGVGVPFSAARLASIAEILTLDRFSRGNAFIVATRQALQTAGFAIGGVIVAAIGAHATIGFDAATYWLSGALLLVFLRPRPAPWMSPESTRPGTAPLRPRTAAGVAAGFRVIAHTPRMPYLLFLLGVGPAVSVVAEGLAVPFSHELGHGTSVAGVIMAANPLGSVLGLILIGRLTLAVQQRLTVPLAVASAGCVTAAGAATWLGGSVVITIVLIAMSGVCLGYLSTIQSEVAELIAPHLRGRVFGLANAILMVSQGAAIALAGVIAASTKIAPALVGIGIVGGLAMAVAGSRMLSRWPPSASTGPPSTPGRSAGSTGNDHRRHH
jgi:MFS family permease